ncbi:MAG TPA: GtrA family protein [Microthrixaceae bacterium]|nr:GtrA family protein [Microthrixaceae bacterium]MCO5305144.1 GtrA family protein [Microthrixaceae bacterium]HMU79138.1 GtrA family protein [Microthrixaceae bacterium]HMV73612.1 GtrA family protein [Microthrixaceae bacterium]HMX06001.1 GtrA family protein [Microthrixaceae bacterium]
MKISPSAVIDHARSEQGRKQIRYAAVSVVFVPVGQILIQVLGAMVFDRDYTKASIVAAAILTVPNFFANKMWVWKDTSRDKLRTQVLVFWVAAMLGVAAATGLTYLVEQQFHNEGAVEALAVFCAQLVGFGIVWVGRYLILDRWLFKVTHHGEEPGDDELDMLHGDLPI